MTTRLHVDWTRCDGHGSCAELLPDLLEVDDFGFPRSRSGDRDPVVPRRDEDAARHAVRNCPLMALRMYDVASAAMPGASAGDRPRPRGAGRG